MLHHVNLVLHCNSAEITKHSCETSPVSFFLCTLAIIILIDLFIAS